MKIAIWLLTGGVVNRGAEHSMLMLAEDWVKLGHQVTVFQTGPKPKEANYQVVTIKLPFKVNADKPKALIGKILARLYLDRRGLASLIFSLKTYSLFADKFDVLIPTDGFWQVMLAKIGAGKAKVVCVGLAGIGWTDADTLRLKPDHFVALSTAAKDWVKEISPQVPVSVIPLQVDAATYSQLKPNTKVKLKNPIILTVAALSRYKRVDRVIEAVKRLNEGSLLIVGRGEEAKNLKALAQSLLPDKHQFLSVTFEELPAVYAAADVFTLASQPNEAFGQVIIEAMAAGLPIVTTNDPIRREILGDKGIYIDPQKTTEFASGLASALRMRRPVSYDLERFDRTRIAQKYEQLFGVMR